MSKYWPLLTLPTSIFFRGGGDTSIQPLHILKERHAAPDDWTRLAQADPNHLLHLHIGVRQSNFAGLEKRLFEISDLSHHSYGAHLSAEQVNAFIAPLDETIAKLHSWLESYGIGQKQLQYSPARDWISIPNITVSVAESLLKNNYHVYRRGGGQDAIRSEEWSLPSDLHGIVDLIHPTNSFFGIRTRDTLKLNSR